MSRSSRLGTGDPGAGRIERIAGVSAGSASWRASSASSAPSRARAGAEAAVSSAGATRRSARAGERAAHAARAAVDRSPARRERSTSTCVAPSASAARNGIAADRPASMQPPPAELDRRPGEQRQRCRAAQREPQRCGRRVIGPWRSTASPVSTSVAIGCSSVRAREHRLEEPRRELLVALLDEPPHVDHGPRRSSARRRRDELVHEPRVGPGRDAVAHAPADQPHRVERPRRRAVGGVEAPATSPSSSSPSAIPPETAPRIPPPSTTRRDPRPARAAARSAAATTRVRGASSRSTSSMKSRWSASSRRRKPAAISRRLRRWGSSAARASISSTRACRSAMSSRSVPMLSRVTSSPTRSATSSRSSSSLLIGVNVTGVARPRAQRLEPLVGQRVHGPLARLARLLARLQVAELREPLRLDVVLALPRPVEDAPAPRHLEQVVRAHALAPDEAEDLVGEQAELRS